MLQAMSSVRIRPSVTKRYNYVSEQSTPADPTPLERSAAGGRQAPQHAHHARQPTEHTGHNANQTIEVVPVGGRIDYDLRKLELPEERYVAEFNRRDSEYCTDYMLVAQPQI